MIPLARQFVGESAGLIPFLEDPHVTDILINGTRSLFVERRGRLVGEPTPFSTLESLHHLIERLLIPIGKRVDAAQPCLDGRLPDGTRFHIVLPPIAVEGPLLSLRKFREVGALLPELASGDIVKWLELRLRDRHNVLISGGTGAGKTTLLCRLLDKLPAEERITVLEETREIRCAHPHVVHLEARGASPEGTGEVTLRTLIRNALRMRPDRLVLGECRGGEAFDLLQAMNTGHSGSLSTIHANSARDALRRLESLVYLSGIVLPALTIRDWIATTIREVVHLERVDGERRIGEIISVSGLEGDVYRIRPRYRSGVPGFDAH